MHIFCHRKSFDDIVRFLTLHLLCDVTVDHKRLAFYCLDTGNGFNNDVVSLYIEQCNVRNVANVVVS